MSRREHGFSKPTKREALKRAQGKCEAEGELYGLPAGVRCNGNLSAGFEFDHRIAVAIGGTSDLSNAVVACKICHRHKSTKHDTPLAARTVRQQDKHNRIEGPKKKIQSRGFQSYQPRVKQLHEEFDPDT